MLSVWLSCTELSKKIKLRYLPVLVPELLVSYELDKEVSELTTLFFEHDYFFN